MALVGIVVPACFSDVRRTDTGEPPCRERQTSIVDWIDSAAFAECSYFTRCLEDEYPGYGSSPECIPDATEVRVADIEDGTAHIDACLAEEVLFAYLEGACASGEIFRPLPYSYAYKGCVQAQGLYASLAEPQGNWDQHSKECVWECSTSLWMMFEVEAPYR